MAYLEHASLESIHQLFPRQEQSLPILSSYSEKIVRNKRLFTSMKHIVLLASVINYSNIYFSIALIRLTWLFKNVHVSEISVKNVHSTVSNDFWSIRFVITINMLRVSVLRTLYLFNCAKLLPILFHLYIYVLVLKI